ncbi:non-specific serine/threonine protein kinase [Toxoplasma gondii ARI]|uniref:Non-specific serine/threonine protein kinase n=1 Tax=Toxoplasma gondii ARI TaxID=1074872 RepID=A0A139Y8R7_TOXGO|nr:non-specific serine/threonine protein kinase [Toxoplasma gondii ARI]
MEVPQSPYVGTYPPPEPPVWTGDKNMKSHFSPSTFAPSMPLPGTRLSASSRPDCCGQEPFSSTARPSPDPPPSPNPVGGLPPPGVHQRRRSPSCSAPSMCHSACSPPVSASAASPCNSLSGVSASHAQDCCLPPSVTWIQRLPTAAPPPFQNFGSPGFGSSGFGSPGPPREPPWWFGGDDGYDGGGGDEALRTLQLGLQAETSSVLWRYHLVHAMCRGLENSKGDVYGSPQILSNPAAGPGGGRWGEERLNGSAFLSSRLDSPPHSRQSRQRETCIGRLQSKPPHKGSFSAFPVSASSPKASPGLHRDGTEFYSQTTFDASQSSVQALRRGEDHHRRIAETRPSLHVSATARAPSVSLSYSPIPETCDRAATRRPLPPGPYAEAVGLTAQRFGRENGGAGVASLTQVGASIATVPALSEIPSASSFSACASCTGPPCRGEVRAGSAGGRGEDSVSWEESSSLKKAERVAEAEGSLSFFTTRAPTTPVAGKYSMPTSRGSNASLDAGREKGRQRDGDDNRGREKEKAREEKGEVNPRLELQWLDGDNVRWFNEELARKLRQYREKQLHAAANKIQDAWRNSARRQRERENELAVIADKLRKLKGEADGRASGKGQETCSGHRDRRKSHNERESETSSERERGREKLVHREREIEKLSRSESERGMRSRRKREGEKLRRHTEREASTEWGEERENSKKREKERKKQLRSESEMDALSRREREGGQLRRRGRERKEVGERREEKDLETEERSRKTRRERGREGEERRRILSPERAARTIEAAFRGFRVRRTVAHVTEEGRRRMPQQRGGDAEGNLEAFSFSQLKHLDELTQTLLPLELKVLAEASFRQPSGMDGRNGGRRGDKEEREGPSQRRLARGAARDRRRELRAQAILAAEVSTLTARALELRTQAEQHRGFRLPSPAASERQEREGRRPTSTAYARANFGKGEETKRERGKDSSSVPFSGSSSSPISSPFSRPPSLCSEGGEPRGARRRESREKHNMRDRQGGKRRRHATGTPEGHRRRGDEESDESEEKKEKKKDKKKDERDKKRDKKEEHTKEQVRRGLVDLVVEARAQMREEKKRSGRVEDEEESEDIKKNFRRRGMRDSSDSYEGKKRRCHSRSRRRSACRRQVYGKSEETEEVQRRGRHLRRREDQEEESRAPWGQGRVTGYPQAWMDRSISEGAIAGGGVYFPPTVWRPSSSHEPPAFAFHPLITLPSYLPRSPYAEPIPICANRQTHNVTLSLSSASPSFSSTSSPRSLVSFVSSKSTFTREERRTKEVDIEDLDEASEGSEPLGGPPAAATIRAAAAAVRHLGPFSGSIAVEAPESPEERRWSSFSPAARNVSLQTRPEKLQGEEHTKACLEAETTQGTADESVLGAAERARQEKVMLEKEREEAETRVKQLKKHLGEELARQEESRRRSLLRMSASPWRLSRKSSLASLSPSRCVSLDVAEKRHPDTADQKELVERRVLGEADRFTDTDRKTGGAAGTQEVSMGLPSSSLECEAQEKEEECRRREAARLLAEERVKAATGQAQLTLGEREEERRTKSLEDRRRRTLLSASVSPRADAGLVQIRITKAPSRVNGVSAHPCGRPRHPHSPTSASFIPPSACPLASTSQSSVRPRLFSGSPAASVRDKDEAHTRGITEDTSLMKLGEKADRKKEGYEASAVPAPTQAPPSSLGPNEKKGEEEEQNLQTRPEIGSSPPMLSANVSHVESEGPENGAISVTGKSRQQPVHAANLRLPVLPPSVMRPRRTSGSGTPESRSVSPPQAAVRGVPQGQDASKKERNEGDRDQHQGGKPLEGGRTTEGQHSASDKEIFFTPSPSPEGVLSPSSPSLLTPFPTREHAGKPPLPIALSSTSSSSIFASSVPWSAAGQAGDQGRGAAGAGEGETEDRGPNEELEGKKYTKTEEEPNGDKQGPSEGGRTSSQTETSRVTRPLPFLSVQDEGGREERGRLLSTSKERRSHSRPASSPLSPLASPRPLSSQAVKGLRAKPRGAPSSAHSQEEGVENMAHADSVSSLDGSGEGNEKRASEKRRKNEQADTFEGSTTPVREEKVLEKSESRKVRIEEAKADKASESGKPENTGASSGASNATVSSPLASPWTQSPSPVASPSHHACTGGTPPVDSASQASPSIFGTFSLRREAVSETGAKPTRIKRSQATPRSPLVSPRPLSSLREVRAKTPAALTPSTDGTMQREAPKQSDELVEQRGKPMGAEGWQPTQDDEGNKETEERLKQQEEERTTTKAEEERKMQEEEERKKKKEEEERTKKREEEERKKQEEEERKKKKEEEERKKKKEEEERKKQEEEERKKKKEEEERKKKKEEEERQKRKQEERQKKKEEEERKKKEEEERKKKKEEEERKKKKEEEERTKKEEEERTKKEEEERKKQEEEERKKKEEEERKKKEEERKKKEEEARKKQEGGKRQTDEEHGEKKAESSIGFDSGSRGEKSRAATNRIGSEESPKEARKEESSRSIVHKDRDGAIKKGERISKEGELIDLKEHLQTHEEHGPRKEDLDHRAVRRKLRDHQQAQEQQALLQQQARSESLLRRLRAAVKIQRAWRRHRKRVFRKKTQEKKALSADALRKQEEKRLEDERRERERRHQDLRQRMALLAEARRREEEGEAGERRLSDEEGEDVFSAGRKPEILEEEARRSGIRIFEPIVQEGGGVSQRTVTLYDRSTGTNEIAKRRQARAAEPRPQLRADPQASRRVDKECVSIQSDGRSRDDDARSVHAISRKASRREKRGSVTSEEGEQGGGTRLQEISDSPREEGASSAGESTDELPRIVLHMPSRRLSSSSENISSGDEAASQDVSDDEGREGLRRSAAQPRPEQEDDIRRRIRRMLREALDEKMRKSADSGVLIGDGIGVVSHMKRHSDAFGGSPHLYAVPRDIVSEACRDIHPEPAGRLRIGSERRFLEDGDARERGDRDKGRDSPKAPTTASPRSPRIPSADSLARHTYFFQQRRPSVEGPVEEVGRGWSTTQEASSSRGSSTAVPFDPAPVTSSREVISPASAAYSSSISWSRNCVAPRGSVSSHTTLQQREAKNRSKMSWLAPPSDSRSDETDSEEGFVFVEKQPAYRETVTGSSLALATRAEPREAAPQPGSQATPRLAPSRSAVPSLEDRRDERLPPERHSFVGFKEQESRRGLTEKETFSEQTRTDTPLGETGKNESGPPRSGVQDPIKTVGEIFHCLHDRDRDCLLGQLGYPSQASGLFAHTDKPDHVAPVVKPPRCRPSSECPSEPNSVPLLSPREERLEGSPRRLSDPRIPALLLPEDVVIGPTGHRRSDFTRRLSQDNKREADAGT